MSRSSAPVFHDFGPFRARPRACARGALVARTGRLVGGRLGRFPQYRACCRSSVVEHSIGNGEVDSSILSGSTSLSSISENLRPFPHLASHTAAPSEGRLSRLPVDKKDSSFGRSVAIGRPPSRDPRPRFGPHERVAAKGALDSEVCNGIRFSRI